MNSIRVICFTLSVAVAGSAWGDGSRHPDEHFFHQSFGDLRDELAIARENQKIGILIMFENDDCPWCRKMRATVLNRSQVQDFYPRHFRVLSVDTEGDTPLIDFTGKEIAEKDFALKHNRVRATPVFVFFDLQGRSLARYTGATRDLDEFLWLGEFVAQGHYKNQNFTKYKRARRKARQSS